MRSDEVKSTGQLLKTLEKLGVVYGYMMMYGIVMDEHKEFVRFMVSGSVYMVDVENEDEI